MSYYRPMRVDELVKWLVENEFVHELDAPALAEALVEKFDVLGYSSTAT